MQVLVAVQMIQPRRSSHPSRHPFDLRFPLAIDLAGLDLSPRIPKQEGREIRRQGGGWRIDRRGRVNGEGVDDGQMHADAQSRPFVRHILQPADIGLVATGHDG